MKLLIDADFIVYKSCAAAEDEINWGDDVIMVVSKFSDAFGNTLKELKKIQDAFPWSTDTILFFSDSVNFRKKIFPDYKGHRNRKKPCGYRRVIKELAKEFEVIKMPSLEADDALGIYATLHEGNTIVSPDKDMKQIPGQLYDLENVHTITPEEGMQWHYIQTLAGDQTDGYSGVPGLGVKRSAALFAESGYSWSTIVKAFADKDLSEDVALMNARLAKILTCNDYDLAERQPILWTPTDASVEADIRAGLPV